MKTGVFRHFRTHNLYQLICESTHTETGELFIIYKSLKTGKTWARPKEMFYGMVTVGDGAPQRRFTEVMSTDSSDK